MMLIYTGAANRQFEVAQARMNENQDKQHPHGFVEIADTTTPPAMQLEVTEDVYGGWNINLNTKNFIFAPEDCGKPHIDGHGHAHLYIDDQKVARLYSPWYHLGTLPPGKHEIKVVLTSNDHNEYVWRGLPVSSTTELVVM